MVDRALAGALTIGTALGIATVAVFALPIVQYVDRCMTMHPNASLEPAMIRRCIATALPTGHPNQPEVDQFLQLAGNYLTWAPVAMVLGGCLVLAVLAQTYLRSELWRPDTLSAAE